MWGIRYDPVVPGSAAKTTETALRRLLDDISAGSVPPSADPY